MKVKELIEKLKAYDQEADIEIQYYNVDGCQALSWPSINGDLNIYEDEDEDGKYTNRVIIDLGDF